MHGIRTLVFAVLTSLALGGCGAGEEPGLPPVAETPAGDQAVWVNEPHPEGAAPRIDVGICLDATGSMEHLIEAAKSRIREIDRQLRAGSPAPSVRFGFVAYRDRGDAYVTRLYGLSPDIETAGRALADIRADGGGDDPEHVVAGLRRAVSDLAWDPEADLKFLFLVGDAAPHLDYGDESDIGPVLAEAQAKDIIIGAIAYGEEMTPEGYAFWKRLADETGGPTEGLAIDGERMLESILLQAIQSEAAKLGIEY